MADVSVWADRLRSNLFGLVFLFMERVDELGMELLAEDFVLRYVSIELPHLVLVASFAAFAFFANTRLVVVIAVLANLDPCLRGNQNSLR